MSQLSDQSLLSMDFKIVLLEFVYNQTFNTIYILLHNIDMQNWDYNDEINGLPAK